MGQVAAHGMGRLASATNESSRKNQTVIPVLS